MQMAAPNTLHVNEFLNIGNLLSHPYLPFNNPVNRPTFQQIGLPLRHHARGVKNLVIGFQQMILPFHQIGNIVRTDAKLYKMNGHAIDFRPKSCAD